MPGKSIRVAAAVIRRGGEILLARRKEGKLAGLWEFPGGKIEPGETPEACLERELFEELAVRVRIGAFIGSSAFAYPEISIELLAFWVEWLSGEFVLTDHDALRWVRPGELTSLPLAPADLPFVPLIAKAMGTSA